MLYFDMMQPSEQSIEGLPSSEAALKNENFSERELREREIVIRKVRRVVDQWTSEHLKEGDECTPDRMAELTRFLGIEHKELIDCITKSFPDREKYIGRPAVKLYQGVDGKRPDIWLLGWRADESNKRVEETDIHDHVDSQVAVYVHEGSVNEMIYAIDGDQWRKDSSELEYHVVERGLSQGSTVTIGAPYIHIVSGQTHQDVASTIHAYYPPLDEMNFYEERNGKLVKVGDWKEQ